MLQILQKNLLATSKTHLSKPIMLGRMFYSSQKCQDTIPDLSIKFAEILRNIKVYNESLQSLETLSDALKDNITKFSSANINTKTLNSTIVEEMESTIANMQAGEHRRDQIMRNTCEELIDTMSEITEMEKNIN